MKLGLKALVIALVMALAAVPAAFAGNGHGGGKPSWAGQGKPSWAGQGKPSWAGQGHAAHTEKVKKPKKPKHHQQEAGTGEDDGTPSSGSDLDGLNPAQYCRAIQGEMNQLADEFATMFGTNPNHANAFGKCVSRRAHGEDLSGAVGGDQQEDTCDATEPPASDGTGSTGAEDEDTQDEGSADEAADSGSCGNDDSASDEQAGHEQEQGDDEQGEEDQGQDEGNDASDEGDSSGFAGALRFLRL
jgi:hypothetical protein